MNETIGRSDPLRWAWLGRVAYRPAWELQEALRARIVGGDDAAEHVLFLEHTPVITLGRSAVPSNVLEPEGELERRGVDLVQTNRGGDVTYHGPGQLVIYPVLRLRTGLREFVETLGIDIAEEIRSLGVEAEWRREPAGVWVGTSKIAACGVHVHHQVAIHGYALNVRDEALDGFRAIVPCGLAHASVTSLERERPGEPVPLPDLAARLAARLCRALGRTPVCSCDQMLARYDERRGPGARDF